MVAPEPPRNLETVAKTALPCLNLMSSSDAQLWDQSRGDGEMDANFIPFIATHGRLLLGIGKFGPRRRLRFFFANVQE